MYSSGNGSQVFIMCQSQTRLPTENHRECRSQARLSTENDRDYDLLLVETVARVFIEIYELKIAS